jgi:lysozyme
LTPTLLRIPEPMTTRRSSRKACRTTRRKAAPLSPLARAARLGILVAAMGLASCAVLPTSRYPAKGDAKPHGGVAAAHRFPIHGIDLSKWQGRVDWAAIRAAGTQFAFIKATEGGDHVDPKFLDHWYAAKRAGIPRGAYHFVYWCRPAHEQAEWFRQNVPQDPDALPPVLDLEWNGHSRTCPRKVSREEALAMTRTMLDAMETHTGKRPIIYTDITFHAEVLEGAFDDYPYWLRSVAAEPHERYNNRRWTFWQFTTTGRVPGIDGDVDRNTFYGTENQWRAFLATDCDPRDVQRLQEVGLCGK